MGYTKKCFLFVGQIRDICSFRIYIKRSFGVQNYCSAPGNIWLTYFTGNILTVVLLSVKFAVS